MSRAASPTVLLLAVAIGLLLVAAATVPLGETGTATPNVPAALIILAAALVALSGWILFFEFVADRAPHVSLNRAVRPRELTHLRRSCSSGWPQSACPPWLLTATRCARCS